MNSLISISLTPKNDADRKRLARAVRMLMQEDPSMSEPRSPKTPPRRDSFALPEPDDDSVDR